MQLNFSFRRATVADSESLMLFGKRAFNDVFYGHPKNNNEDMKLYTDEAFTVEQFRKEISNAGNNGSGDDNGNKLKQPKNIFVVCELEGSEEIEGNAAEEEKGEGTNEGDTHHVSSASTPAIIPIEILRRFDNDERPAIRSPPICSSSSSSSSLPIQRGKIIAAYAKLCVDAIEEGIVVSSEKCVPVKMLKRSNSAVKETLTKERREDDASNRLQYRAPRTIELGRLYVDTAFISGDYGCGTKDGGEEFSPSASPIATTNSSTFNEPSPSSPLSSLKQQQRQQRLRFGLGTRMMAECHRIAVEEEGFVSRERGGGGIHDDRGRREEKGGNANNGHDDKGDDHHYDGRGGGADVMWLSVWEYHYTAQRFYSRLGFRFVGQHVFQLGNDPSIDLLMQKEL